MSRLAHAQNITLVILSGELLKPRLESSSQQTFEGKLRRGDERGEGGKACSLPSS